MGTKHGEGLRPRLLRWYAQNGGEMLTSRDVALKFGCSARYAEIELSKLKAEGALERLVVYRARNVVE